MNDIFISYAKEDKKLAMKMVTLLEQDGYKCWISPRDLTGTAERKEDIAEAIENSKLMLLIFSREANSSTESSWEVDVAVEAELQLVIFQTVALPSSLTLDFFINSYDHITAFDKTFDKAYSELKTVLEEEDWNVERTNNNTVEHSEKTVSNNNNLYIILGIVAAVIIGVYFYTQRDTRSDEEITFVGSWQLSNYKDDVKRNDSLQQIFNREVKTLYEMQLVLNEDFTYSRTMGKQSETGIWSVSRDGKTFSTTPKDGVEEKKAIVKIDEDEFVIRLSEEGVQTDLTFSKKAPSLY